MRISPFDANEELVRHLVERGLRLAEFENITYGRPVISPLPAGVAVQEVDRYEFNDLRVAAWSEWGRGKDSGEARSLWAAEFSDWRCFVGFVDGQPAGFGASHIVDGCAFLANGFTRPEFRHRGCQLALLTARIAAAASGGCELVLGEASPGSESLRNMQRAGLETAFTELVWRFEPH